MKSIREWMTENNMTTQQMSAIGTAVSGKVDPAIKSYLKNGINAIVSRGLIDPNNPQEAVEKIMAAVSNLLGITGTTVTKGSFVRNIANNNSANLANAQNNL